MSPVRRAIDRIRRIRSRLAPRMAKPVTLSVTPEFSALHLVDDVTVGAAMRKPGVVSQWIKAERVEEAALKVWLKDRTAGVSPPVWHDGSGGAPVAGVHLCRTTDALCAPEFGAVILPDGAVLQSSVAEALYFTPTLGALPFVEMREDKPVMVRPASLPSIPRAALFVPWGGRFNYGHFVLDGLTSLAALAENGFLETHQVIAPPLTEWQRTLTHMFLGRNKASVREIAAPLVAAKEVVFASSMNHFLHAPNAPLAKVRERLMAAVDLPDSGKRRLYLTRRGDEKRRMVNEDELEAVLRSRGFEIIDTAALSVDAQIAAFRDAEIIIAATGAALTNCLFCPPGAKVFELQPTNYTGIWVRGLCHYQQMEWYGFFVQSPIDETDVYLEGKHRPGVLFQWRVPIDDFMAFLDANI